MLNLLGDLWFTKKGKGPIEPPWEKVLALGGTHLHLYGKTQARIGRKMGHLNITASQPKEALMTLDKCLQILDLPPIKSSFLAMISPYDH
jgi:5-(carboxyamino)imidazole ribonucleotide synthase